MTTDRRWKPFSIPQQFLDSIHTTSSPLTCLPTELLIEIFHHASPIDQLALALTSKHLLQVSTFVSLKTSSLVGRRVSKHSATLEDLLKRVKPLSATGRPKRAWQVCVDCLRYRPTRKSYWERKRETESEVWDDWVMHWNDGYYTQCPECRCHDPKHWSLRLY